MIFRKQGYFERKRIRERKIIDARFYRECKRLHLCDSLNRVTTSAFTAISSDFYNLWARISSRYASDTLQSVIDWIFTIVSLNIITVLLCCILSELFLPGIQECNLYFYSSFNKFFLLSRGNSALFV